MKIAVTSMTTSTSCIRVTGTRRRSGVNSSTAAPIATTA